MVKMTLRPDEPIQIAVRRFRKLVDRAGLKKEMRKREYYENKGWGVIAEDRGYRFIHFDSTISTNLSSILNGIEYDRTGWISYCPSFATVEAAQAAVESADWK